MQPIVLAMLAVVPFLRSIRGEFLFDDPEMWEVPLVNGKRIWRASRNRTLRAFHRVPRDLVHVFDNWLWQLFRVNDTGLDAAGMIVQPSWPWHVLSLAFHVGTTLCVWSIMSLLFVTRDRAFLAAALFAVHPLHVSAVGYISARAGVQSFFFTALGFLHALAGGWHWLAVPVCHYFAWKSKEDGLIYLAFYPVIIWKFFV